MSPIDVVVETGTKRTFASALEWPGWARVASSQTAAIEQLDAYRDRYVAVLETGSIAAPVGAFRVVETLRGDAGTDFGAPTQIADVEHRALRAAQRVRLAHLLEVTWHRFDDVAARASDLRAGPRGGGRSASKIVEHVSSAEVAYARGLGLRVPGTVDEASIVALRARILGVVRGDVTPDREGKWPVRYAVRRIGWHVLDHLFEIEDRTLPR